MTDAKIDSNNIPTALGVLNTDGTTPTRIKVNPSNHGLKISDGTTGSDLSGDRASRDSNYNTVLMGVSSADGVTPTEIYVTSLYSIICIEVDFTQFPSRKSGIESFREN